MRLPSGRSRSRCSNVSGGKDGDELIKFAKGKLQVFKKKQGGNHADFYVIEKDG